MEPEIDKYPGGEGGFVDFTSTPFELVCNRVTWVHMNSAHTHRIGLGACARRHSPLLPEKGPRAADGPTVCSRLCRTASNHSLPHTRFFFLGMMRIFPKMVSWVSGLLARMQAFALKQSRRISGVVPGWEWYHPITGSTLPEASHVVVYCTCAAILSL